VGLSTYLAENQKWFWFFITLIIFAILEGLIKLTTYSPVVKYLKKRENEEFKLSRGFAEYGIKDIFLMDRNEGIYGIESRNKKIQNSIDNGNEFYLLAETGKSYLDDTIRKHWDYLKPKLDKGHRMNILIINPFSEGKNKRNRLNGVTVQIDPKLNLQRLKFLNNHYDNLTIKFTQDIYCSLFFTDKYLIYDPYHLGKSERRLENYFIAIDFVSDSYGYRVLKNHFDASWDDAMTFEQFKAKYDAENRLIP
jgi:hypothetical protein